MPFIGLNYSEGVAVYTVGDVYITDEGNSHGRVLKLPSSSTPRTNPYRLM